MSLTTEALADLGGRIMLTHRLDPALAAKAIGIDAKFAEDIIPHGTLSEPLTEDHHVRLELFVNILVRQEVRLAHDSKAIRQAWVTPLAYLDHQAPGDIVGDGVPALRRIRGAVEHMSAPRVRLWRVGH